MFFFFFFLGPTLNRSSWNSWCPFGQCWWKCGTGKPYLALKGWEKKPLPYFKASRTDSTCDIDCEFLKQELTRSVPNAPPPPPPPLLHMVTVALFRSGMTPPPLSPRQMFLTRFVISHFLKATHPPSSLWRGRGRGWGDYILLLDQGNIQIDEKMFFFLFFFRFIQHAFFYYVAIINANWKYFTLVGPHWETKKHWKVCCVLEKKICTDVFDIIIWLCLN